MCVEELSVAARVAISRVSQTCFPRAAQGPSDSDTAGRALRDRALIGEGLGVAGLHRWRALSGPEP